MRALWLPKVLRDAGLTVHEVPGWKTRGSDSFGPIVGLTCHETRGSRNSSDAGEIRVLVEGRPGLPGPISQLYLSRDGDWHVVASGRANHNKTGFAGPNKGYGNSNLIGIEAQHALGEPWTDTQYGSYVRGAAAITRHVGYSASRVAGHKEHQPGEKSDPSFNMTTFRRDVVEVLAGGGDDVALTAKEISQIATRVWTASWGPEIAGTRLREARDEARKARMTSEAVLAAVTGGDTKQILDRIDSTGRELAAAIESVDEAVAARLGGSDLDTLVEILTAAGVDKAALAAKLTAS